MADTSKYNCRLLLDLLLEKGVSDIVYSPGSRNAPLLIGIEARKDFKTYQCFDERTAGFVALGIAVAKQKPVALCCTSGTALYNYGPAIAEAYYQNVPLIVLSADRPIEWIDQDDSQTLIQSGALHHIVKQSFDIPEDATFSLDSAWFVNRTVNEAINVATSNLPGPVHINIRLSDPLSKLVENNHCEHIRVIENIEDTTLTDKAYKSLSEELCNKNILIVAGFMNPNAKLNKALLKLQKFENVWICCETLSNLHLPGNPYAIDRILNIIDLSENKDLILNKLCPDILISIGGALVSRKLKEFLRNFSPDAIWTLGNTRLGVDCFKNLTKHINVSPENFFTSILKYLYKQKKNCELSQDKIEYKYKTQWCKLIEDSKKRDDEFFNNEFWSELSAFKYILNNIPEDYNLFLSNGTPVRYGQLFTERIPHAVYSNRGVSGIDGTNATALGLSCSYSGKTLLITGDLSFGYDTGILGLNKLNSRLKIIVINNQGGGIFRFINTTKNLECRERMFCANPGVPVKGLAEAYNWKYYEICNINSLEKEFQDFILSQDRAIMEIIVDPEISAKQLIDYFTKII